MRKFNHILLIIALFNVSVIVYLSLIEINDKIRVSHDKSIIKTNASAVLEGVNYIKTVKDKTEFKIIAKSAQYFKSSGSSTFNDIKVEFFTDAGSKYHLTGDSGSYDIKNEDIRVAGNVVLLDDNGYELVTDSLYYSYKDKHLSTRDKVRILRGDMTLEGIGMELDLNSEHLVITENVKGHFKDS